MKNLVKFTTLSLLTAALIAAPDWSRAQNAGTNAPASAATAPSKRSLPFTGKVATMDASAGVFTVGELKLAVTSTTKITTNGVPATLADFKVGDSVSGAYRTAADGTKNVTTLKLAAAKATAKKKKTTSTTTAPTNTPAATTRANTTP
jgi:hypothetical protein